MDEYCYLYGLVDHSFRLERYDDFPDIRISGMNEYIILYEHVSAEEYSKESLIKNMNNQEWLEKKIRKHLDVLSRIMETNTILPFSYPTIYTTSENMHKALEPRIKELGDNYEVLKGKKEWGVEVCSSGDEVERYLLMNDKELRDITISIEKSTPGKSFLLRKKRKDLLDARMNEFLVSQVKEALEGVEVLVNLCTKISIIVDDNGSLKAKTSCLVSDEKYDEFVGYLSEKRENMVEKGLNVIVTGPWPPFNFISN